MLPPEADTSTQSKASIIESRSQRVDLLRGLAIAAVLLLHFSLSYSLVNSPLSVLLPKGVLRALIINGNYGVTIFFVISGYLITTNSIRRYGSLGATNLKSFYVLRAARILPPLLLALLVIVPLAGLGVPSFRNAHADVPVASPSLLVAVVSVLTFWHNLLMESAGYFNYCLNIYWSLSIEEVFYIAYPLVCVLLRRQGLIAMLCLGLIAVAPFYRAEHADNELYYMYGNFACFDAIALGCLTGMLMNRWRPSSRWRFAQTFFGSLMLLATYLTGIDGHEALGFTGIAVATSLLLSGGDVAPSSKPRSSGIVLRGLRWLGQHSYELYLFHIIVLAGLRNSIHRGEMDASWKLPCLVAYLAASTLIAYIASKYFANPFNLALRRAAHISKALPGNPPSRPSVQRVLDEFPSAKS